MKDVKDFATPEDAIAHINKVEAELESEKSAHEATKTELANAIQEKEDAETVAAEVMEQAADALKDAPKNYVTRVEGLGKVKVNFGVDGLSKEDLLEDHAKIVELHKKGSHAVTVVPDAPKEEEA